MSRRRRVEREIPEFVAMVRRMIRALARRVGAADPVDLAMMVQLREELDRAIADAVAGQRANKASWADIGEGLGTSREAAYMRYGRPSAQAS